MLYYANTPSILIENFRKEINDILKAYNNHDERLLQLYNAVSFEYLNPWFYFLFFKALYVVDISRLNTRLDKARVTLCKQLLYQSIMSVLIVCVTHREGDLFRKDNTKSLKGA